MSWTGSGLITILVYQLYAGGIAGSDQFELFFGQDFVLFDVMI